MTWKRVPSSELPYSVESVDVVAETPDLRVSILTLAHGHEVPWHYHTSVTDTFVCLSGRVVVQHGRDRTIELTPGASHEVPARTPHRVSGGPGRFLIVQGVGPYDFVPTRGFG